MTSEMFSIHDLLEEQSDEYVERLKDRFWDKVDKSGECWEWTASTNNHGYGQICAGDAMLKAHRLSKYFDVGKPLDQKCLHTCHNPRCVRNEHLYLGTRSDNMVDRVMEENHPSQKLSPPEARDVHRLAHERDLTQQEIADRFGISQNTVSNIKTGYSWSHLFDDDNRVVEE